MKTDKLLEKYHLACSERDGARKDNHTLRETIRDLQQDIQVWKTRAQSAANILTREPLDSQSETYAQGRIGDTEVGSPVRMGMPKKVPGLIMCPHCTAQFEPPK